MAALTLAASVRPDIAISRSWQRAAPALALLLVIARTAWMTHVWIVHEADVDSVERALARVPAGAAILPTDLPAHGTRLRDLSRLKPGRYILRHHPSYWHLPVLAVMERLAFVPILFTAAGKQPLTVRPPWNEIAVPEGKLVSVDWLDRPEAVPYFPYLAHWRDRFDYVLVVNADLPDEAGPRPGHRELDLVADEGFAQLYRIRRDSSSR
jgi:hypothetical protein